MKSDLYIWATEMTVRIVSNAEALLLVYLYYLSRWSVFQRTLSFVAKRASGHCLESLKEAPFSFAGAKVRRFSETTKSFHHFFAKNLQIG